MDTRSDAASANLVRSAQVSDLPRIGDLLLNDANQRHARCPALWPLASDAREKVEGVARAGIEGADPTLRELWLVAEDKDRPVGITHSMQVPVPPIYDPKAGTPGLLLDDCFIAADAPPGTAEAMLAATEAALRQDGAKLLIASCAPDGPWTSLLDRHGYEPVTLYMGKAGLDGNSSPTDVRRAIPDDVPGIVAASAEHRRNLHLLNPRFWNIHPEADARFDSWMRRSLTFKDRDMLVSGAPGDVHGYVIAQPISPLLVPAAHDIRAVGVIDDFYHRDFSDPSELSNDGAAATDLLKSAEAAFARRNVEAALVVCPAAWASKILLLERQGYRTAKVWMIKR